MKYLLLLSGMYVSNFLFGQPTGDCGIYLGIYEVVKNDTIFICHNTNISFDREREVKCNEYTIIDCDTNRYGFKKRDSQELVMMRTFWSENHCLQIIKENKEVMTIHFLHNIPTYLYIKIPFLVGDFELKIAEAAEERNIKEKHSNAPHAQIDITPNDWGKLRK